jgi:hypothetical protein
MTVIEIERSVKMTGDVPGEQPRPYSTDDLTPSGISLYDPASGAVWGAEMELGPWGQRYSVFLAGPQGAV